MSDEVLEKKVSIAQDDAPPKQYVEIFQGTAQILSDLVVWIHSREKSVKVQVVQNPPNADSSDEEDEEQEEPDADDAEILENLPDDTEVCTHCSSISVYSRVHHR